MDLKLTGKVRFKKLDGRNTGHGIFKYYARTYTGYEYNYLNTRFSPLRYNHVIYRTMDFVILRNWAWETWGQSCEFKDYMTMWQEKEKYLYNTKLLNTPEHEVVKNFPLNEHWCFDNQSGKESRIYLRGDQEKMWFEMRWL